MLGGAERGAGIGPVFVQLHIASKRRNTIPRALVAILPRLIPLNILLLPENINLKKETNIYINNMQDL